MDIYKIRILRWLQSKKIDKYTLNFILRDIEKAKQENKKSIHKNFLHHQICMKLVRLGYAIEQVRKYTNYENGLIGYEERTTISWK